MACGTPPVAFGVGGIPDTITDGVNGRMILGFDTAAMAWAVTELLFAPARAEAMARAARETIEESYSLDLQAARYEALLRAMGAKTAAGQARDAILFGLTRSTSWKATRALRGRRERATPGSRPDADRPVSARHKLAEVMTLLHSTSWEMMAPVRLLHRAADRLWPRLRDGRVP